ncbi:hypothetical protein DFH28DRAFT_319172 [Melampsora americana]|nr:hypothetical protein DFH28DRAFT_319172 [Melampsora americana]
MILTHWAVMLVMLDLHRCGSVHPSKPALGSTAEHLLSEAAPDSIQREEAAASSKRSARQIIPIDIPPHAGKTEGTYHTTSSDPVEAGTTPSPAQNVDQAVYRPSQMTAEPPMDNQGQGIHFAVNRGRTVPSVDHSNGPRDSRPIFSLGKEPHGSSPVPIYASAFRGIDGMDQRHVETYLVSGYPIQQHPYHPMQNGFYVPPRLVDPLSGITYVPFYPTVSIASPFYGPAIPTYLTPTPPNNWPYDIRKTSSYGQVKLRNYHSVDTMKVPLESKDRHSALSSRKSSGSSRPQTNSNFSRSLDTATKNHSQDTSLEQELKQTNIGSETEFPPLQGESTANQSSAKKLRLKQKSMTDKALTGTDESSSEIGKNAIFGLKEMPAGTQNDVEDRDFPRLKKEGFRRPQYSERSKSNQHVNNLIASSMNFDDVSSSFDDNHVIVKNTDFDQRMSIGSNWVSPQPHRDLLSTSLLQSSKEQATSSAHNILTPWPVEREHPSREITPNPSGKGLESMGKHDLHIGQETLEMDLWIRKLKDAAGYLTFHTRKDLYNQESPRKDSVSTGVNFMETEQQPSASPTKVDTKLSSVLPPIVSGKIYTKKTKTTPYISQETDKGYQYVKKEILKTPTTDVKKDPDTFPTWKVPDSSLKVISAAQGIDTQTNNQPHVAAVPETLVQKDKFMKRPLGRTEARNIGKQSEFNRFANEPKDLVDQISKVNNQEEQKKAKSNTKVKDTQVEDIKLILSSENKVPDKKALQILESDDLNGVREKFIVPSSIKSGKTKKANSSGSKRNTKVKVASKPTSQNTENEDPETKPSERITKSNYVLLKSFNIRFPELKFLRVTSPIQQVPALWSWVKTTPEAFWKRVKEITVPRWVSKNGLSSNSASINSPGKISQKHSPTMGLQSNPGLLARLSTKISDLRLSNYFGHTRLIPSQTEISSFWYWVTHEPEPMQRTVGKFQSQTRGQEDFEDVNHSKEFDGQFLQTNKKEMNGNQADRVGIKDPTDLAESSGEIDMEDNVQDRSQNLSLKAKTESHGTGTDQSFLSQENHSSMTHHNHISDAKFKKQRGDSDEDGVKFICSLLKIQNKKKFLAIKVTEEDYYFDKSLNVNEKIYDLIKEKSQLSRAEFARRVIAVNTQMNQFEIKRIIDQRRDLIKPRLKDILSKVFKADIPWETFTSLNKRELIVMHNQIENLYQVQSDVADLRSILGSEFYIRQELISYLSKRKVSNNWWDEGKLQEARKQGIDIVKVLSIGDVLEFGEMDITKNSLRHRKTVAEKMKTLHMKFILENNDFPWHYSPERAWLESQPALWKLYQERLRLVILAFETLESSYHYTLTTDDGESNENSWWQYGDYLMWIDEGINMLPMPDIGDSLKLGRDRVKNAKILKRVNWKTKLQNFDSEQRIKIQNYFEKRSLLNLSKFEIEAPEALSTFEKIGNFFSWS